MDHLGKRLSELEPIRKHLQKMDGIQQKNIVAPLAAAMKLNDLLSTTAERAGVMDRAEIMHKSSGLLNVLKDAKEDVGLVIENTTIDNVPVRIARPENSRALLPGIVYFHGGGFYTGSPDTHNALTSMLARDANVVVVSVDYRLAPKYHFPDGLDDCDTVAKYVLQYGDAPPVGIDPRRVALAGDSAGGNFAAVLTMRYASNPLIRYRPRLQVLIYPVLQFFDFTLPSYQQEHFEVYPYSMEHVLSLYINEKLDDSIYRNNHTSATEKRRSRPFVDWTLIPPEFRRKYTPLTSDYHEGDPFLVQRAYPALQPDISPLLVKDSELAKLPPTYVLTVGHDRLRDEGWIYAERVRNSGVPVEHDHEPSAFHASITNLYGITKLDVAHKMVHNIVDYLKRNL